MAKTTNATVAIIGGGPHALAVLTALHERSYATPQFRDDAAYALRVGFNSHKLVGTVAVIDPGERFCEMWDKRFLALGINKLRSPLFAHPDAYDDHALLDYAIKTERTDEISHPKGAEISRENIQRSAMGFGFELHGQPSAALFKDFCAHLAERHPHTWVKEKAAAVTKDGKDGKYTVTCEGGSAVVADAVVIATGPQGPWNVPKPFAPFVGSPAVVHTAELFAAGFSLAEAVTARTEHLPQGSKVLVIGGGLTAAQAALAAARGGFSVVMRSRDSLRTRDYDVETEWLDRRSANRKRFEFLQTPLEDRPKFLRDAVGGGSLPLSYLDELIEMATNSDTLKLEVDSGMEKWDVSAAEGTDGVVVNGKRFELVILATGIALNPASTPLYEQVRDMFPTPFMGGFPELDDSLRWSEEEDIFVVGCNAGLQLGPGALNLMGAMRSGQLVAESLHRRMWKDIRPHKNKLEHNIFSVLAMDDSDDSDDSDDPDDSDGDEGTRLAACDTDEGVSSGGEDLCGTPQKGVLGVTSGGRRPAAAAAAAAVPAH
mmetsp:Transcript_3408/g.10484  ORF Transcript_3408/g.10484 Transcript_3408/m.10484 type:complete len:544 (-) Transcript_3408:62-1693(-)